MAISLEKGQHISLSTPDGEQVKQLCVGVNWGAIDKLTFYGGTEQETVDLDASCVVFDQDNKLLDTVYFGQLTSQGIKHLGDDVNGDMEGDDGLDNEIIIVDLDQLPAEASQVVFVLNSFQHQDFKKMPFASIHLYEGNPTEMGTELANYDIANDVKFGGAISMVLC